jgi:DNA-binding LacI/PurR family transcriptional regulator
MGPVPVAIVWAPPADLHQKTDNQECLAGYRQALQEKGLPVRKPLIREVHFQKDLAFTATTELLHLKRPPSAIFFSNERYGQRMDPRAQGEGSAHP